MKPQTPQASLSRSSPAIGPNWRVAPQREQKRTFGSSQSGIPPGPRVTWLMRTFSTFRPFRARLLRAAQSRVRLIVLDSAGLGLAQSVEASSQSGVGDGQDLSGEQGRVLGTTDCDR